MQQNNPDHMTCWDSTRQQQTRLTLHSHSSNQALNSQALNNLTKPSATRISTAYFWTSRRSMILTCTAPSATRCGRGSLSVSFLGYTLGMRLQIMGVMEPLKTYPPLDVARHCILSQDNLATQETCCNKLSWLVHRATFQSSMMGVAAFPQLLLCFVAFVVGKVAEQCHT